MNYVLHGKVPKIVRRKPVKNETMKSFQWINALSKIKTF